MAQRFIPDFGFIIDGTFNTNTLHLVLISVIGVDNQNHSFSAAMSFTRSESKISFDFVFKALNEWIFKPTTLQTELPYPRVCISDQATGLLASLPSALPHTQIQLCDWHVSQNIKKRLADKRYTKEERLIINSSVWDYIKSSTQSELAQNRAELYAKLKSDEISYIEKNWVPHKPNFLRIHTSRCANLGCYSSQRAESFHPVIKTLLNQQLSLEEASRRLGSTIMSNIKCSALSESQDGKTMPRMTDLRAFIYLIDAISAYAIS